MGMGMGIDMGMGMGMGMGIDMGMGMGMAGAWRLTARREQQHQQNAVKASLCILHSTEINKE
jgi:hypothetical protein